MKKMMIFLLLVLGALAQAQASVIDGQFYFDEETAYIGRTGSSLSSASQAAFAMRPGSKPSQIGSGVPHARPRLLTPGPVWV